MGTKMLHLEKLFSGLMELFGHNDHYICKLKDTIPTVKHGVAASCCGWVCFAVGGTGALHKIDVMREEKWPSRSPDLNPIEYLWVELRKCVSKEAY
jgi:hypothetical protein